jgi:hypothetical protein
MTVIDSSRNVVGRSERTRKWLLSVVLTISCVRSLTPNAAVNFLTCAWCTVRTHEPCVLYFESVVIIDNQLESTMSVVWLYSSSPVWIFLLAGAIFFQICKLLEKKSASTMLESLLVNVAFRTIHLHLVGGTAKNRSYWGDRVEPRQCPIERYPQWPYSMVPMKIKSIWNRIKR